MNCNITCLIPLTNVLLQTQIEDLNLSENRAKEVFYYLKDKGIPSERLSFKGYGESNPIESNNTELGRSKNRRTSFSIVE